MQGSPVTELDLADHDIATVVWATGFTGDLSWARLPLQDKSGAVVHNGCASSLPGLWYAGFPWLTRRRSGIFYGVESDAEEVRNGVLKNLAPRR